MNLPDAMLKGFLEKYNAEEAEELHQLQIRFVAPNATAFLSAQFVASVSSARMVQSSLVCVLYPMHPHHDRQTTGIMGRSLGGGGLAKMCPLHTDSMVGDKFTAHFLRFAHAGCKNVGKFSSGSFFLSEISVG